MNILIVGAGSVGKRHGQNLSSLDNVIFFVDPRKDRREEVSKESYVEGSFVSLAEAMSEGRQYDGVVIASPPVFHVEQALLAINQRIPVLLEKPVAPDEASAKRLATAVHESGVPLLLGYSWRWWEPLGQVKTLLEEEAIGDLRAVQFVMSAHLADWHPWENYQDFFMASSALGGGALLDESHWIDLMFWMLGAPQRVFASIDKISDLEIDTDDNVDIIAHFGDGLRVSLHLDLYGRPHQKYIRFIGEQGTIYWTVDPNRVVISRDPEGGGTETSYDCERNDMFLATALEFIEVIRGKPVVTCGIEDGVKVLSLIETLRKSNELGEMIEYRPSR